MAQGGISGPGGLELRAPRIHRKGQRHQDQVSGAAKLELEQEFRGAGATAAGQRLLQAEAPAKKETKAVGVSRRRSWHETLLRWFTTVTLYASFLGMVRPGGSTL